MAGPRESCGIVAVASFKGGNVAPYIYWGLVALNHRGQQSYGILSYDGDFKVRKGVGLISYMDMEDLSALSKELAGSAGIGHVRYATSGRLHRSQLLVDAQPHVIANGEMRLAIAYNGNIVNVSALRRKLSSKGFVFSGTSDAEVLAYEVLDAYESSGDMVEGVRIVMEEVDGAYSVVGMMEGGRIFAFRDPKGIRPLVFGHDDDVLMIASESVALDINGVPFKGFVNPGELVVVDKGKVDRYRLVEDPDERLCAFEYAYFSRPDSKLLGGRYVYQVRRELGRRLANRYSDVASRVDVVIPVPQTAIDAAYGFHEESGKPIEPAIIRNRYISQRAFIMASNDRELIISRKYNMLLDRVRGLRVALVDDSTVRGDTLKHIVENLKRAGAEEVHVFSTFPKIISPCFYGIDMATFHELIGFNRDDREIASILGADSINYQTIDDFCYAVGSRDLCLGCVTMKYPTPQAQRIAEKGYLEACRGRAFCGRLIESIGE